MKKKANRVLAIIFLIFAIGVLAVGITWSGEVKTSMKDTELRLAEIQQDIDASADNSIISGSIENYNQNVKVYNSYLDMYDMGFKLIMTLIIADLVVVIILIAMDKADEEEAAASKSQPVSEKQDKDKDREKEKLQKAEVKVKSEDVPKDRTKHRFGIKSGLEAAAKPGKKTDGDTAVDLRSVVTNDMVSTAGIGTNVGTTPDAGMSTSTAFNADTETNVTSNTSMASSIGADAQQAATAEAKMQKTNLGGQSTIELTKQLRAYKNQLAAGKITEQEFIQRKEELLKSI